MSLIKTKSNIYKKYRKVKNFKYSNYLKYLRQDAVVLRYYKLYNWGDYVNPFIVEKVLGVPVVPAADIFNFLNKEEILGIGSIINGDLKNTVIWGSGFISEGATISNKPSKVLALRGKLSQRKLRSEYNIISPNIYGDPALLFPQLFNITTNKRFKIGVIPHYSEKESFHLKALQQKFGDNLKIIDIQSDVEDFAESILSCEMIFSSSLHGLILAETYNIPTCRLMISNNLIGGNFKFNDYYSGVGISKYDLISIDELISASEKKIARLVSYKDIKFDGQLLIDTLKQHVLANK